MAKENYYITTSIPYVNGDPHIGFGMEILQADILARYARLQGKNVLFSTGTDEHGTKIMEKAAEEGVTAKVFVDKMSQSFRDLIATLNISNDRFIRTTDAAHEERAQIIWKSLAKDIYKGSYVGLYDVTQEEYVTESQADPARLDPAHPKAYRKLEEENYFFRLSTYTVRIKEAIESNTLRIIPSTRRNEILSLLKDGLDDISISRPSSKISWGIPVPSDKTQVMYVWFEALLNYITVLGYPEHADFKTFWPADVQIIGKDILRFHAATWPGILMSLGLPLQKILYVHGHIGMDGQKMSKSIGNVVAPQEIVTSYGVDAFRYYFARHISSVEDGDFTWVKFETAYNNELANELGNGVQRVVSMINKYQHGVIGDIPVAGHDMAAYHTALADCRFDVALSEVWEQVRGLNQYIDEEKPWTIAKMGDEDHLREVLAYTAGCIIEIADLLQPFMPETSAKIITLLDDGIVKQEAGGMGLFPKIYKYTEQPKQHI